MNDTWVKWKKYLDYKDVRFWLTCLFIVRLYAITLEPLEFQHPWRQADGLMIARNFYETQANIFYPMVDTAGEKSGIAGSEFPILNYSSYLLSIIFGYQSWYGRLIVLVFSTIGSLYFYKSIRIFFGESVAFNATIVLTTSYWFSYSRKTFPDCFAAGLCLMALYFVLDYLQNGKARHLILYLLCGALGGLSKISLTLVLSVVPMAIFFRNYPVSRKVWASVISAAVLMIIFGWYLVWVPYLNRTFGYGDHFTTGCPLLSMGWDEIRANWREILRVFYLVPTKYVGFCIFLGSFIYMLYRKQWLVLLVFIIPYLCFLFMILKTGKNIISDQYYVLCAIPPMAFVSGFGLSRISNKTIALVLLIWASVENIGDQISDFRVHKMNMAFANLETIVDSVSNRHDLFVINSGPHCPTAMYFAHRKGWTVAPFQLLDPAFLDDVKGKGCKYVLVCKEMYLNNSDVTLPLPQIFESKDYRIYSLK